MNFPPKSSSPIADFSQLLSDRANLDLSPIELAEILWLALQKGEFVPQEEESPGKNPPATKKPQPEPSSSSPSAEKAPETPEQAAVVAEPPPTSYQEQEQTPDREDSLPVSIPEICALRNRREISRSLRPLMRKVPSKLKQIIDEVATVTHIAETQTWNPVVVPEPERWLELAIVVEVTNLLEVWQETIAELCHVMERQGAFRDVRTWQLKSNLQGDLELWLQTASGLKGSPRRPMELRDFGGRRLVLLLSDCTSKAWRTGKILDLLGSWSRTNPVTIVQLLPENYWDRTALDSGYLVALRAAYPGALSRDWNIDGLSSRQQRRMPSGLKFPVITLQPNAIAEWAKAIAASHNQQVTGILLGQQAFSPEETISRPPPLSPRQLVLQFRATASARAQELADRMAVLPINWSVIRLVQKNWHQPGVDTLQDTFALPIAEIFLSGLIQFPLSHKIEQQRQYDFVDGVRDILLGVIPISEAQEVGEQVATAIFQQLPLAVQKRVGADIERRYGEALSYFEAFLIPDLPWGEEAGAKILPFAKVAGDVLRRWGGEYAALAEELQQSRPTPRDLDIDPQFPELKTLTFEVATIELETEIDTNIDLQRFEFDVASIEINQSVPNDLDSLIEIVNQEVFQQTGQHLEGIARLVLKGALTNQTYKEIYHQEIVDRYQYTEKQLRYNIAPQLWKTLSALFTAKVNKGNIKRVIEHWIRSRNLIIHRQQNSNQYFKEDLGNDLKLEMVAIPGGTFIMGSPEEESDSYDDERPQHPVTVSHFYMGRYPITQAQWRVVAGWKPVESELDPDPSRFKEDYQGRDRWQRPVEQVSWDDAQEFCQRLSRETGKQYRLPTEAEWEYACRAVISYQLSVTSENSTVEAWNKEYNQPFHFGATISTELANYDGNYTYEEEVAGEYRAQTTPVGYFQVANNFGLSDLHGNVWEWCEDDWHGDYDGAPNDGSAWLSGYNITKMIHGGSGSCISGLCRSACRHVYPSDNRDSLIGFRVVCVAPNLRKEQDLEVDESLDLSTISLKNAYKCLRDWYRHSTNFDHTQFGNREPYVRESIPLITAMPSPEEATVMEIRAVFHELLTGKLEWSYTENYGQHQLVDLAINALKNAQLPRYFDSNDIEELKASGSRILPYILRQ